MRNWQLICNSTNVFLTKVLGEIHCHFWVYTIVLRQCLHVLSAFMTRWVIQNGLTKSRDLIMCRRWVGGGLTKKSPNPSCWVCFERTTKDENEWKNSWPKKIGFHSATPRCFADRLALVSRLPAVLVQHSNGAQKRSHSGAVNNQDKTTSWCWCSEFPWVINPPLCSGWEFRDKNLGKVFQRKVLIQKPINEMHRQKATAQNRWILTHSFRSFVNNRIS